ncbi:carbohydrate ABC transporter permease [Microbacterium sp. NPDC057944]|uniref:carbohydrate ABC transporter permease n=1 Tax=Microbacterium sp. NPDC057944 TaxID=3346286 RepID=UPI0036DDD4CA
MSSGQSPLVAPLEGVALDEFAHRPSARRRTARGLRVERRVGLAMVAPAVLLLLLFIVVPAALAFGLAFTNARLISPYPATFAGIDNFARLFTDASFWRALLNIAYFAIVVVPLQGGLALVLALLINSKVRGTTFFRTVYFLPVVTSMVVVSLLWLFMYRQDGLINIVIERVTFGLVQGPDWLADPATSMPAIILMSVWQGVGFHMIIWLSGLQTISADLYEAADLDGTSRWQRFWYITWPGLRNTRNLILVTITIQALALFTQISVMTQGGPLDSTTTVVYQAVESGYSQQETGYASAISLVFFVLVLIVSGIQRYLTREKD